MLNSSVGYNFSTDSQKMFSGKRPATNVHPPHRRGLRKRRQTSRDEFVASRDEVGHVAENEPIVKRHVFR